MSAKDISRFVFQPEKRYAGVRMQQGRVILDSDWNESERIDDEEARRTLIDMICAKGTPNQGFLVGDVTPTTVEFPSEPGENAPEQADTYDFSLASGSFYLGGLRFEVTPGIAERLLRQSDWLQIDATPATLPAPPTLSELTDPNGNFTTRSDLVYLHGWEQCVTSVEDSELREQALGGPDTSVRVRRMRRAEVLTGVADNCPDAFETLIERLVGHDEATDESLHLFDRSGCELRSRARLRVTFNDEDEPQDPCKPKVTAGFLGAENQTIRVQLTAANRFIWGYDNASPYYRVQVLSEGGELVKIKFLTLPRDQAAQPLKGQAVEILPWGALLPNGEKVADLQGHLSTVETGFDPEDEDGSLTITTPVPSEWVDWLDYPDHVDYLSDRDPEGQKKYFYLRLWTGGSGEATAPDHPFNPRDAVSLQGTGLSVTFSDPGMPGDFWIIAARPNTPDVVVPWELMHSAPPAGPRFFFAPLALIRWSVRQLADQSLRVEPDVHDCRELFRPLCEVQGCTTITVGDGRSSRGDFGSIQAALDYLPANGGEIQLLPGVHEANVLSRSRQNVKIRGCDKQTRVIPGRTNREGAIFQVVDSQCITLEHMDLVSLGGTGIAVHGTSDDATREIDIGYNRILAFETGIRVTGGSEVHIHYNRIRMLDKDGAGVAIAARCEDSIVERNDLGVVPADRIPPTDVPGEDLPDPNDPCADPERVYANLTLLVRFLNNVFQVLLAIPPVDPYKAIGGIQIAAGSERVKVLENQINGGAGNGVTLGGTVERLTDEPDGEDEPEHVIEATGGSIQGYAVVGETGRSGIGLSFSRDDGTTVRATSGGGGFYIASAEPGRYAVSVTTPGLRIASISVEDTVEFGRFHRIAVVRERPRPDLSLAFLYDVQIDRNEILNMGLSGIGAPLIVVPARQVGTGTIAARKRDSLNSVLGILGNPVVTLGIDRNHIHDCWRNPLDNRLRAAVQQRGLGGISLGFCENLSVTNNRIERNGVEPATPVCGLFVRFGEKVAIQGNIISENGPSDGTGDVTLQPGQRGGIVLVAASFGLDEVLGNRLKNLDTGRYACRIHDNVVHQPVGQALRILAIGPVSICANRFHTALSGDSISELLAGALLVVNLGGSSRLPAGLTLFNDNQTRLGPASECFTTEIIWSGDDLGYDGNQTRALTQGIPLTDSISLFVNSLLLGDTLRATNSRFKEPTGERQLAFIASLVTATAMLNNTNNNQGDHCIFATNTDPARPPHATGNLVIDDTLCQNLDGSVRPMLTNFAMVARI